MHAHGDGLEVACGHIQHSDQLVDGKPRRTLLREWPELTAADAVAPARHGTDDVAEGVMQISQANLELLMELLAGQSAANFEHLARRPRVMTEWNQVPVHARKINAS